jgi:hypothetical protein
MEALMTDSPSVSLRSAATVFVVNDVGKSVAHYRDLLGVGVEFTYGEPMSYAGVERGGVLIHLQAAAESERQMGQGAIYIFVTNVDSRYEELQSHGAPSTERAERLPVRYARLLDQGSRR